MRERAFWCVVIKCAFAEARNGSKDARDFFREQDGIFRKVCGYLDLPADEIQRKVMAR